MKRTLILTILFLLAAPAVVFAQPSVPGVRYVSVAPTGACSQSPPVAGAQQQRRDLHVALTGRGRCRAAAAAPAQLSGQANGVIPLATASTIIGAQSALSDNGTTVTSTEPVHAPSFVGSGSDPFTNLPSNPTHLCTAGDLFNNAGVLTFCQQPHAYPWRSIRRLSSRRAQLATQTTPRPAGAM